MGKSPYYDGTELLNMKDLDGEKPSTYIITSNRTAGKTFFFLKHLLEKNKETNKQFALIYRYQYELESANKIVQGIIDAYPSFGSEVTIEKCSKGLYCEIYLDGKLVGFAVGLFNTNALKKYSNVFADVDYFLMDEYQSEDGRYLKDEFNKLISLIISMTRGHGKMSRPFELYLLGNMITLFNPYLIGFNLANRVQTNTKFIKGSGVVAQFLFSKNASQAIQENKAMKCFLNTKYMNNASENLFLYDASSFCEKMSGKNFYMCTIKQGNYLLGVRKFTDKNIIQVSNKVDKTCKNVITFSPTDHNANTVMMDTHSSLFKMFMKYFKGGLMRFDNIKTKNIFFEILSIDIL